MHVLIAKLSYTIVLENKNAFPCVLMKKEFTPSISVTY